MNAVGLGWLNECCIHFRGNPHISLMHTQNYCMITSDLQYSGLEKMFESQHTMTEFSERCCHTWTRSEPFLHPLAESVRVLPFTRKYCLFKTPWRNNWNYVCVCDMTFLLLWCLPPKMPQKNQVFGFPLLSTSKKLDFFWRFERAMMIYQ